MVEDKGGIDSHECLQNAKIQRQAKRHACNFALTKKTAHTYFHLIDRFAATQIKTQCKRCTKLNSIVSLLLGVLCKYVLVFVFEFFFFCFVLFCLLAVFCQRTSWTLVQLNAIKLLAYVNRNYNIFRRKKNKTLKNSIA